MHVSGFRDEVLKGVWKGYRSSRLSLQYRVIFQVRKEVVSILAIDMNAHDYKRKLQSFIINVFLNHEKKR